MTSPHLHGRAQELLREYGPLAEEGGLTLLFVYGTLMDAAVQRRLLGMVVGGTPAAVTGYARTSLGIEGETYPALERGGTCTIAGLVLEVGARELRILDAYETDAYVRIPARTTKGQRIELYVKR